MRDFFNFLKEVKAYKEEWHNRSENIYKYKPSGTEIDFISVDEPIKVRSRRRNFLWLNEANEFKKEDYRQLSMRTDKQIFMDYNPSDLYHWVYDLEKEENCVVIHSTYKDNPFLSPEIIKEIEGYKDKDQNYWRIYGLGLKGLAESLIYTHWEYCDKLPESYDRISYGLDFGYNNPSAIVRVVEKDDDYFWEEILYQSHLTNQELIGKMKELGITENDEIYPDVAEPARIQEIKDAGFNIRETKKDVRPGIDFIKSKKLYIVKRSVNLAKELRSYSWKVKDDKILDEPVAVNNHLCDAGRYAEYSMNQGIPFKFS